MADKSFFLVEREKLESFPDTCVCLSLLFLCVG